MAVKTFGINPGDVVTDAQGNVLVGQTFEVYASPGGTRLTGLLDLSDLPIASGLVTTDSVGRPAFKVDSASHTLWLKSTMNMIYWPVQAADLGLRMDIVEAQALAAETASNTAAADVAAMQVDVANAIDDVAAVYAMVEDTGWQDLIVNETVATAYDPNPPQCRRIGPVVHLRGGFSNVTSVGGTTAFATVPAPEFALPNYAFMAAGSVDNTQTVNIILINDAFYNRSGAAASWIMLDGISYLP